MQCSANIAERQHALIPFFEGLERASQSVLMLDYDGTLAPFTADRGHAAPYAEIPDLISRIMRCRTRVVLISGRAASELLFLCGIYPHPEIWGSHGIERLYSDGSYHIQQPTKVQREGLELANRSLRAAGLVEHIEAKPVAIAVHWRGLTAKDRAAIESTVRAVFSSVIKDRGLELFSFDGGLEIRSAAKNKGDAVRTVLRESGNVAAAYLGDDQTDEDAFHAIKGHGLAVLVREEHRPTAADVWLRPPGELEEFLQEWLVACGETK